MNVIGLVSIPGMMTGQVLGGSPPLLAAKYQAASQSLILTLTLTLTLTLSPILPLPLPLLLPQALPLALLGWLWTKS